MKHIRNFRDLEQFGIDGLTGEACAYGYRILCDVTQAGKDIISACIGCEINLHGPWNSQGIGSIMLAPQMMTPLAVFALFADGCRQVFIMHDDSVVGIEPTDDQKHVDEWLTWNQGKYCDACRRYGAGGGVALQYFNPGFSRHQHQMSGRTS